MHKDPDSTRLNRDSVSHCNSAAPCLSDYLGQKLFRSMTELSLTEKHFERFSVFSYSLILQQGVERDLLLPLHSVDFLDALGLPHQRLVLIQLLD